MKIHSQW